MTLLALTRSEVRRLAGRRVLRWSFAVIVGVMLASVLVSAIRSTGPEVADDVMRLDRLWGPGGGSRHDAILQLSVYLFIAVVGIGATAVGADLRAGTVGTILTWEPRRVRFSLVRLGAVAIVAAAFATVVLALYAGTWALGAALRGSTVTAAGFWTGLAGQIARSAAGAALLAVLTGAIAFLTRSTVGAVFAWFGYLVAVEGVLGQRVRELRVSTLIANFAAFVGAEDVEIWRAERFGVGGPSEIHRVVATPGAGVLRVLVVVAMVMAAAVLAFRHRDAT